MSFMYPRTISITRAAHAFSAAEGSHNTETSVATAIPASIQAKRNQHGSPPGFPAPTNTAGAMTTWLIFFKLAKGSVQKGDKITDDLGITYEVDMPYWNSLGYRVEARLYKP